MFYLFVIHRFSNNGRLLNHEKLSACSKQSVVNVLAAQHRTSCLRKVNKKKYNNNNNGILQTNTE
jgi:hypothetical protein